MKKTLYTIGSAIIFVIAALVFVLLPALSSRASTQEGLPPLGKYNGKEIKYEQNSDFANFYQYYAQNFQREQIDLQTQLTLFNNAFDNTVQKLAYTEAVEKSGYTVSQESINRAMLPYFYDESGNYSPKLYKQTPASQVETLQKQIKGSLTASRFNDDMFGLQYGENNKLYGLKSSKNEDRFLQDFSNKTRSFNVATFNMNDYPDSEKIEFAKANEEKFIRYNMSVITCDEKSKAQTVAKRLLNNEINFNDAVEEYSTKSYSDSDGKLNSSYSYELEKIIKDKNDFEVLKSLAKDANSSVIETTTGFSIFHVTEEATKPDFSNESTIRDVYNYLNTYEVGHIEDYYTKQANEFVTRASVDGFENACSQFNIQNNVLSSFPLNYGSASIANSIDTSIQGLSGCDSNEHFLQTAFSLKQDEISSPIVNDKSIIVLQMRSESLNDATEDVSFANEISAYDSSSVSSSIKESPKVENNVLQVFIKYFLNNE